VAVTVISSPGSLLPGVASSGPRRTRSTPRGLRLAGLLLVALIGACTGASTVAVIARQEATTRSLATTSPGVIDSQMAFTALSDADTAAAGSLLAQGRLPALRQQYLDDIARASTALTDVGELAGSKATVTAQLRTLTVDLPFYTGIIEVARGNSQRGLPVSAAYLGEANNLMRTQLLPAADRLYVAEEASLSTDQHSAGVGRLVLLSALILATLVVSLVVTQVWLRMRFRRTLNPGLLVGTAVVVVAAVWAAVALMAQGRALDQAASRGTAPLSAYTQARILALEARSDDELALATRDSVSSYQQDYAVVSGKLATVLRGQPDSQAVQLMGALARTHAAIRAFDAANDLPAAAAVVSDESRGNAPVYGQLDSRLAADVAGAQGQFNTSTGTARSDLAGLAWGLPVLGLLAAAGVLLGLRPRLREYR